MNESQRELLLTGASWLGVTLNAAAVERFSTYLALLQLWGKKINLTTRLEAEEAINMKMTSRERMLTALANGRPDRLPCQVHGEDCLRPLGHKS